MRIELALPTTSLNVTQWKRNETKDWEALTTKVNGLRSRVDRAGVSPQHEALAKQVLDAAEPAAHPALSISGVARAVLTLWSTDRNLAAATLRNDALTAATEATASRLAALALARIYYTYFDHLELWEEGLFHSTSARLQALAARQRSSTRGSVFTTITEHTDTAVGMNAPAEIATGAVDAGETVREVLDRAHLAEYSSGRFGQAVREQVYLTRIRNADPHVAHGFLRDFRDTDLVNAASGDRRRFGHLVVEALASAETTKPSPAWIGAITDIAGDPRARGTSQWQTWWQLISDSARDRVIAWLASQDLRLFLNAVEQYGERNGITKLKRMFPDRKRFLEGLHDLKLIRATRLFAGNEARTAIRLLLGHEVNCEITPLSDSNDSRMAAIYLDCQNFHIIEGSHDFRLWIYSGDQPPGIMDWNGVFSIHKLRREIPEKHAEGSVAGIRHAPTKWISDALMFLGDHGTYIPAEQVTSTETYQVLNENYELPARKR